MFNAEKEKRGKEVFSRSVGKRKEDKNLQRALNAANWAWVSIVNWAPKIFSFPTNVLQWAYCKLFMFKFWQRPFIGPLRIT